MAAFTDLPDLPGVEHREVLAGGVRLHVAEAGSGPPLILLHGWPQHWWCWRELLPRLAEDYHVLAVDLRGWGWSEAPPGDYAKGTFAEDIHALLDGEGLERVRLLGHDWGAYTAFLLALRQPERIERMVTLDIVPPWRSRPQRPLRALPTLLAYQGLAAAPVIGPKTMTSGNLFIRTVIRLGSAGDKRWSEEELDTYADRLREPARARASSACYRTFLTRELPATARSSYGRGDLKVPTLLVMGSKSILGHALDPRPAPNLEIQWIKDAGHFLPEEAPERVLDVALPFLAA
jgi:pimeloyl-ACP methyl ester carboxylesterase